MAVSRIVVFLQENKTTDFYFASMAARGAAVGNQGPPASLGSYNVGSPVLLRGSSFSDDTHHDHVHIGFRT